MNLHPTLRSRRGPALATLLLLGACVLARPLAAQPRPDPAELEARLPGLTGVERLRTLADLTEAYRSTAPEKAVSFAESALTLAASVPDAVAEVRALNERGWALMELGRYAEAVASAEEGLARARAGNVRRGEARALNNLGVIARRTGDYGNALSRFDQALEIYRAVGDEAAVATSLNNLSVVLGFDVGDYQRALEVQLEALAMRERLGDDEGRYQSFNTLGVLYDNMDEPVEAVRYLNQALEGWRKLGLQPRIAATLSNLAGVYARVGELDQALALQREALGIRETLSNPSGIAFSLASIGEVLTEMGRTAEARQLLERSLAMRGELGERKNQAQSHLALARLHRAEGSLGTAREHVDRALALAREISAPEEERDATFELAALLEAAGDAAGALEAYQAWNALDDRLFSEERARRIEALEAEYRQTQDRREIERLGARAELAALEAQRRRTQMLVVVLLLLVAFLLYRRHTHARTRRDLRRQVEERTAELSEANARLRAQSLTDALTGLPNRRYFFQAIEADVAVTSRAYRAAWDEGEDPETADLVFYVLDLDDFKSVNDQFGHAVGDLVLQQTATVLRETGRASDMVIRWGGEEFLVVSRQADREGAAAFAERIRQAVRSHMFSAGDGRMMHRTCSVGFAAHPFIPGAPDAVPWDVVLGIADQAAYAAKRGGRDAWVGVAANAATRPEAVGASRHTVAELVESGALSVITSLESTGPHLWSEPERPRARARE